MRFLFSSLTLTLALAGCTPEPGNSFKSAVALPLVTQPDGFQIDFPGTPEAWQSQFECSQGTMIVHHLTVSQGGVSMVGITLLLDQRFYSVHVGGPKSTLDAEKAQRFFDSFKIDSTR